MVWQTDKETGLTGRLEGGGGAADSPQEFYLILFIITLKEQFVISGKSSCSLSSPELDEAKDITFICVYRVQSNPGCV